MKKEETSKTTKPEENRKIVCNANDLRSLWLSKEKEWENKFSKLASNFLAKFKYRLDIYSDEFLGMNFVGYAFTVNQKMDEVELVQKFFTIGELDNEGYDEVNAFEKDKIEPDWYVSSYLNRAETIMLAEALEELGFKVYMVIKDDTVTMMAGITRLVI